MMLPVAVLYLALSVYGSMDLPKAGTIGASASHGARAWVT